MTGLNASISLIIIVIILLWLLAILDDGIKYGSKIFFVFMLGFIVVGFLAVISFFAISFILHITLGI